MARLTSYVMNQRPVEYVEGEGSTSVGEAAEVIRGDAADIMATFPGGFGREGLLLLRHGIVNFQVHRSKEASFSLSLVVARVCSAFFYFVIERTEGRANELGIDI